MAAIAETSRPDLASSAPRAKRSWGKKIPGLTEEDRIKIGENIRAIRLAKGMPQRAFFKDSRQGQVRQSRIELGKVNFTFPLLNEEAFALGVLFEEVLPEDLLQGVLKAMIREEPKKSSQPIPEGHLVLTDEIRTRIGTWRIEAGITQDQMLGRDRQTTYSRIERDGVRSASKRDLEAIARRLGRTYEELIGERKPREEMLIWQAKPPLESTTTILDEKPKDDPVGEEDARKIRRLKGLMTTVARVMRERTGIKPPHIKAEDVQVDFSSGDKFQERSHFHIRQGNAEFSFDARSAIEVYGQDSIDALQNWLKLQSRTRPL